MVNFAIFLLILGIGLLITEIFIPGFGIAGISGVISLVASAIITIAYIPNGIFFVLGFVVLIVIKGMFLFKYLKSKQLYGKLILRETLETDKREFGNLENLLGIEGISLSPLKPYGKAEFNGVGFDVYSEGNYVEKGIRVKVIDVSNNTKIIVKEVQKK